MREQGVDNGRLTIPGTVATLEPGGCDGRAPVPDAEASDLRSTSAPTWSEYQERMRPLIEAEKATWPRGQVDIVAELREWLEPLLDVADRTAPAINGRVLLDLGDAAVVLDFLDAPGLRVGRRGVRVPLPDRPGARRALHHRTATRTG